MTNTLIIEKAIDEILNKKFGGTQQFLQIHQVVHIDDKPTVSRVDTERQDGTAIVYFPVVNQKFYLAVYLDTNPEISVRFVDTEPYHAVYFRATSEQLTLDEISVLTKLRPTASWSKGDKKKFGDSFYKWSNFAFEPNPEADEFEDKLKKLLDLLEQDKEGVKQLVDKAYGRIQVASCFHNGNTMLGGHHINKEMINQMAELNLEIDFDLYAEGNMFVD